MACAESKKFRFEEEAARLVRELFDDDQFRASLRAQINARAATRLFEYAQSEFYREGTHVEDVLQVGHVEQATKKLRGWVATKVGEASVSIEDEQRRDDTRDAKLSDLLGAIIQAVPGARTRAELALRLNPTPLNEFQAKCEVCETWHDVEREVFKQLGPGTRWRCEGCTTRALRVYDAARCGEVRMVEELLAEGADPNVHDPKMGGTALTAAVQKGHVAVVRVLLNCERVDRGMLDDHGKGRPAWSYAKKSGNTEMMALFSEIKH